MTDGSEHTMTIEPVDPAVAAPRQRRAKRAALMDPRRSPDTIADPSPDAAQEEAVGGTPPRTGHGVSIAGGVAVLRAALRNVPTARATRFTSARRAI
jgi:hypothetical protein